MISFIYFDIGGVLLDDFYGSDRWLKFKKSIGVKKEFDKEFEELYKEYENKELCLNRDVDSLIPIFTKKFGLKFPKNYSLIQNLVNRFKKNDSIWPLIYKLKEKVRLGLLTNIYPGMLDLNFKKKLIPPIEWDVIIDSSVVGLQKPDPKIFVLAEKRSKAKKNEILFIDDNQVNIDVVKNFGWKTLLYKTEYPEESNTLIYNMCSELLC